MPDQRITFMRMMMETRLTVHGQNVILIIR